MKNNIIKLITISYSIKIIKLQEKLIMIKSTHADIDTTPNHHHFISLKFALNPIIF